MSLKKKLLAVPAIGTALVAAGVAYAAWTSTGTGSATAKATTAADSVIAAATSAADLFPGAVGSVTVTISNPNPYPVVVNSISAGSSPLVNALCLAGTVTTDALPTDATGLVQADGSTKTIGAGGSGTYSLTTRMSTSAVDACKSQTFSLALTATLSSAA
jgi:hypothetical protein